MTEKQILVKKHYLFPSTIFVEKEPHVVDTILGSCIAVCLFDEKMKIGGINHFMLPLWNGEGLASPKYGNIAIEKLIEKMLSLGASKAHMIAKVFGGASTMEGSISIGKRNIDIAKEQLGLHNIRTLGESVGGFKGRKIKFDTSTGEVLMKYIR